MTMNALIENTGNEVRKNWISDKLFLSKKTVQDLTIPALISLAMTAQEDKTRYMVKYQKETNAEAKEFYLQKWLGMSDVIGQIFNEAERREASQN